MDKLKKVLSGQDTEDRSGLSEVSAAEEARISWKAALLPSRPRRGAQPGHCHRWQRGDFAEGVAPEPFPTSSREDEGGLWSKTQEICAGGSVGLNGIPGPDLPTPAAPVPAEPARALPLEPGEAGGLGERSSPPWIAGWLWLWV